MTTALRIDRATEVTGFVPDMIPARSDGILARVRRPCAEHGCDCHCVGHLEDEGCLVFWCAEGEHPLTFRA
jgi:hypothetical protein